MKFAFSAKKAALVSGIAVVAAAVSVTAYAVMSDSADGSFLGALNSAVNPAKTMAAQISAEDVENTDYISASRIDVTSDGKFAFVNDETAQKVYKIDLSSNAKVKEITVGEQVNNVVVNGSDVYVLYGELDGKVAKYTTDLTAVGNAVSVGHTPSDAVVNSGKLFVTNRFTNDISVINPSSMTVTKTIDVSREPLAITAANGKLYVACNLQDGKAIDSSVASKISVIDPSGLTKIKDIKLLNGSVNAKDLCASPDGAYVYVSHGLGRYAYPTSQLDRGWVNTNAVTILDTSNDSRVNTVMLDQVELAAANPWGIAATDNQLIVSISGTQEAIVIDRKAMHQKIKDVENGKTVVKTLKSADDIPNYLNFLDGVRTRVALTGENPRGVAVANDKAYFAQYISGDVAVVNLSDNSASTISLGTQPEQDNVRYGEALWNDATIAYQNWNSCSSCHPDGHMDSLNWDELGDSLGTARSTKSMLYAHRTPPALATGCVVTAEENVAESLKLKLGEEVSEAIDAYLKSIKPVQSPYLNKDGTLTEAAKAGKTIFEESGCATCHPSPFYTDLEMHDATVDYADNPDTGTGQKYDTPTLVEIWRTAPYGLDGSYTTIGDYIDAMCKKNSKLNLTDTQKAQLAEYVLSIGAEGEEYGLEQVLVDNDGETTANKLIPGSTIKTITYRKQTGTQNDAVATFTLFDASGKSLKKVTTNLSHTMSERRAQSADVNFKVPKNLESGSYFTVTIVSKSDSGKKLASDFTAKYKG